LLLVFFYQPVLAKNFSYQFEPDELISSEMMQLKKISSLGISNQRVNGIPSNEFSGLAWDGNENILYAVSDSGYLYHLKIIQENGTLIKTDVLQAYKLRDKKGKPLVNRETDSEGLTLKRDQTGKVTELLISFERRFRIARFSLQGHLLGELKLPRSLRNKKHYKGENKGLESVTLHPQYGVITAAELPLKTSPLHYQTLYSMQGKVWHFKQSKHPNSSITGLEILPNGDVLVLERAYSGLFSAVVISLRRVRLSSCNKLRQCKVEDIAIFNSMDGWRVDNFEGLTHYQGNQYLMVSDDNKNIIQNTVLVLFEIKNGNALFSNIK
jgi:hypothetical protein